jgi:hypothetical protein
MPTKKPATESVLTDTIVMIMPRTRAVIPVSITVRAGALRSTRTVADEMPARTKSATPGYDAAGTRSSPSRSRTAAANRA